MGVSAPSPLRVGLLGFGLAGSVFHAPLIATTGGLRLDAVVTANPERQARVLRDYPHARVFDRADELVVSGSVDLVVVATPNRFHVALARLAVQQGLPVVVDKPLAATAGEGRELVEEARRRAQNRLVRRLVREGTLGEVLRFESRFERWRPTVSERWRERPEPEEAGGLLFDLGAHLVDQAVQLFGPPVRVCRTGRAATGSPGRRRRLPGADAHAGHPLTPVDERRYSPARAADAGPRRPGRPHEVRARWSRRSPLRRPAPRA